MRNCTVLIFIAISSMSVAQLSQRERDAIADTLFVGNMNLGDLGFVRDPNDIEKFDLVSVARKTPLDAADLLMRIHASAANLPVSGLLKLVEKDCFRKEPLSRSVGVSALSVQEIPENVRVPITELAAAIVHASTRVREASSLLTEGERRILIESLPVHAVEEPLIAFSFAGGKPASLAECQRLLAKVNLAAIRSAGADLMLSVETATSQLRNKRPEIPSPLKLKLDGLVVVIAGTGNDIHSDTDAALTIDLGGDDRYIGRHGAGIGYASVIIDMGGDDSYLEGDASLGSGILGVGIAWDELGDDVYRTGSATLGCGIAGVGAAVNIGGDDDYRSLSLSQGCAMYGVGLLLETAGADRYDLKLMGQGASRTLGVGWLADRGGNDTYRAGGLAVNSPLFADVHYSNAQGFSSGYREDTGGTCGGIGLLTDLKGDDVYISETYAQAASYWYAVASLYDSSGHDHYNGYHYAQSSAMHLCAAFLFDLAGDDNYSMKFGASHAIGHDYGTALLLDRSGSDVYAARDSAPGIGNANGLGIFIEGGGEDRYQGPPGRANSARGSGSLGIFVDLSGQDLYRDGLGDGSATARETWASAYDIADPLQSGQNSTSTPPTIPIPGSKTYPGDAAISAIYRRATQWSVGTAQEETEQAIRLLIEIGLPAFAKIIDLYLETASRLEIRAFVQIATGIGPSAKQLIAQKISSKSEAVAKNAISVCVDGLFSEAAPFLSAAMDRPPLQRSAARAVGTSGARDCVAKLLPLCASSDKILALNSILSLNALAPEEAYGTAEALMYSSDLPIRKAALALAAKFPTLAIASAKARLESDDVRTVRIAIDLLGLLGTQEALKECGEKLIDSRPGVRIQAMIALNGRCPTEYRQFMITLRTDPIPTVRAVAQRIDLGR